LPDKESDYLIKWKKIIPLEEKAVGHIDIFCEAQEANSAKNFYKIFLKGFFVLPIDFLSEAEALVSYLFEKKESKDANFIIKAEDRRILFLIFSGRTIQFSSVDFLGLFDFLTDDNYKRDFIEKVRSIIDFYENQVFHEHGASPVINKIILICPAQFRESLKSHLFSEIKLEIEQVEEEKIDLLPIWGAIKT